MQVRPSVFYTLEILAIAGILVIVGSVAYFFLNTDADKTATDAARKTEILQLQTRAGTYFSRLRYYDGVCKAIGALPEHHCAETEEAYAVETTLTDGTFYCVDSTGFRDVATSSKEDDVKCSE